VICQERLPKLVNEPFASQALMYDLRYSGTPIDGFNRDTATPVLNLPAPVSAYQ
jgi:hypothetical protein